MTLVVEYESIFRAPTQRMVAAPQESLQGMAAAAAEKIAAMRTAEYLGERSGEAHIQTARWLLKRSGGEPPEPADRLSEGEAEGR